ncbi:hypothetical protein [Halorubrum halophilum]|uniref:hypothetical protein n=1 Tax=Halorubrum halophilum TaxID=413816 RepID=UPI00186AD5A2|nr:hypothetical protein [Halorubrum halophilum]
MEPDGDDLQIDGEDIVTPYLSGADKQLVVNSDRADSRRAVVANVFGSLLKRVGRVPVDVSLSLEKTEVEPGEPVEFTVTVRNQSAVGIPLSLTCTTLWGWYVDGYPEGEDHNYYDSPPRRVTVRGSQSYTFERQWSGYIRTEDGYESLSPGEHTLEARVHISDAETLGLTDRVNLTIAPA